MPTMRMVFGFEKTSNGSRFTSVTHFTSVETTEDGSQRFGFEGELIESDAPNQAVTTERMIGMEGPGVTNVMTLTPVEGGTLLTLVVTYPGHEVRDMVLGTGMFGGMEQSYARLEEEVLEAA